MGSGFISVDGDRLLDPAGEPLVLRGVNLGGWMLMENFIDGYPATESLARAALREAMGEARYERFSELFLRAFYGEPDARLITSLGMNCVRLPINYRHFEDDLRPFELRTSGFEPLDRVVELNARHGLYSVIDLHAAQGWQNHAWHSDNHTLEPLLWQHRQFQDRAVWLWEQLAAHYRGNPWVAGYNLLNEPSDKTGARLSAFYRRAVAAGFWDVPDTTAAQLFAPIIEIVEREFPNFCWYPFGAARQVWSVVGEKMLAEFLIDDFRSAFSDVDDDEVEALAGSFRLESCDIRPGLASLLELAARTGRARSGAA